MIKAFAFLIPIFFFFVYAGVVDAKMLPQASKATKSLSVGKATTAVYITPKLRRDRKALIVYFSGLQNATAVSYVLTYKTSVQDEGAMGSLNLDGKSTQSVELLFGTCSKNVCRYHTGIKDAKLEVTYTLKNNKKYVKRYRIKV